MCKEIRIYLKALEKHVSAIPGERKKRLEEIAEFIRMKFESDQKANLTFVCTHNSRRSHFCQIWTAVLAHYLGLEGVQTFSGGTEATALNYRVIKALQRAGFKIKNPGGQNPRYNLFYNDNAEPLVCFSKRFDDSANPQRNFAAIMTCSEADQNCPLVPGAVFRVSIPYQDPKEADGTPQEDETYDKRCRQIASEMYYMLTQV